MGTGVCGPVGVRPIHTLHSVPSHLNVTEHRVLGPVGGSPTNRLSNRGVLLADRLEILSPQHRQAEPVGCPHQIPERVNQVDQGAVVRGRHDRHVKGDIRLVERFPIMTGGGGVKPGITYGTTDEIGLRAVENRVSVADWHATILHLLGLSHEKVFIELNGLKEKLTGVEEAHVAKGIIA